MKTFDVLPVTSRGLYSHLFCYNIDRKERPRTYYQWLAEKTSDLFELLHS